MFVTAFSTPAMPQWRWRITTYGGVVVEESPDVFATITAALEAGRTRVVAMDAPEEIEKPRSWRRWRFGRPTLPLVVGIGFALGAGVPSG